MNKRQLFFNLIRQEICGTEVNKEIYENIDSDTLDLLYAFSKKHDITSIIAVALSKSGYLSDNGLAERFNSELMLSIVRYRQMEHEFEAITSALESEKIAYIPLKGAVIRNYYPQKWMRTSCDIDVLVKEEDLDRTVRLLCEKLSYKTDGKIAYHDISLFSESGVHLELHFSLREDKENLDKILSRVWSYAAPEFQNTSKFVMTNEFLIFHIIAHASYHFVCGGCGMRSLIDLYLLEKNLQYDKEKLMSLCRECSVDKFALSLEKLCRVWFEGDDYDELTERIEDYILNGGMYGDSETGIIIRQKKHGGKIKYLFKRIFPSYSLMCRRYPNLKKCCFLLPFYYAKRLFSLLIDKNSKIAKQELSVIMHADKGKNKSIVNLIDDLGLA